MNLALTNGAPEIVMVCAICGKRRDDFGNWQAIGDYFENFPNAYESHGICPSCAEIHYSKEYEAIQRERKIRKS